MGVAQAVAVVPGISRSGVTISAGMYNGLGREASARFAFLMAAPVIAGAGLWEGVKIARHGLGGGSVGAFSVGFAASAVTGFFTVKYLMRYLKRRTLWPFVIYSALLGAGVLIYVAVG